LDSIPLWAHVLALIVLLACSAFFSISETSMMALNRYRLKHLASKGSRSAKLANSLLGQTEKLLGTILLGNNLINTAMTTLVTALAIRYFGNNDSVLLIATTAVAFLIIIFCEITPKVIGARYPERIALPSSFVLSWLMKLAGPLVNLVNVVVGLLLRLMRIKTPDQSTTQLSSEEVRSVVLDSGAFMPGKHRTILMNLFDLEHITVNDVMTPRNKIEALDIAGGREQILAQLSTCYHNKLPVFEGEMSQVVGILHVRRAINWIQLDEDQAHDSGDAADQHAAGVDGLRALLAEPYFVPSGTPAFTQLQYFQENKQRVGLVVDEYGDLQGLVTLEDIMEEVIGEFTTSMPGTEELELHWDGKNETMVEASTSIRELNRKLGLKLDLDGPKTLNGLLLEQLQDIPDGPVSLRLGNVAFEVMQSQGRTLRQVKLKRLSK
jgi:Mg2+/Co2+ transporter CorB